MLKNLKKFWLDNTGSGAASLITTVVQIIFAITAGVAIVGILKGATGQTFTNIISHLKDIGNSGY
ncbi:hypothetical protein SAMN05660706_12559 [Desulfoscipio geothermicus DSM 3669]|uniref:Uncharacterized protein n=1 Tax=Desulfoscipio geothermicus DSM 3669 TaxID=1121426 RepID=A0A1I6E517_9FIRM|nr:hypothetical protein SAMN05660706_12559 [Desulfoscipio geothermicus DSM 3669]